MFLSFSIKNLIPDFTHTDHMPGISTLPYFYISTFIEPLSNCVIESFKNPPHFHTISARTLIMFLNMFIVLLQPEFF